MSRSPVVVTGGTGFVGANLVRRLLQDGHDVHLLVRPGHRRWRLADVEAGIRWHAVALEDAEGVHSVIQGIQPGHVFHLAAHGAYASQTDARQMVATNVLGTVNLLEAALASGFESFVHTGSSSEYGFKDHAPREDEPLDPNSAYAVMKASATMYCRHMAVTRDVPVTTLRLYSVYGPWEEPTRLLPALAVSGLGGELPPLVDPAIARDFVYVDDAVVAIMAATHARPGDGAVYNVGTGVQSTLAELVDVVRSHFGIEASPEWGSFPRRSWDTAVWRADPSRITAELGWSPIHDVRTGFARLVTWLTEDESVLSLYRDAAHRAATPGTRP